MEYPPNDSKKSFLNYFIAEIEKKYDSFPNKQKAIADLILDNNNIIIFSTIQEIADAANVNVSTVVRFCKTLGFSGYSHLKNALRHYLIDKTSSWDSIEQIEAQKDHDYIKIAYTSLKKDIANINHIIRTLDQQIFDQVIEAIDNANKVLVIGSRESSPAVILASLLCFTGRPAESELRGGGPLGQKLVKLTSDDLLVSFGFYRCDPAVVKATEWAIAQGISNVVITDSIASPLSHAGKTVLTAVTEGSSVFQSSAAPIALVNAIVSSTVLKRQDKVRDFLKKSRDAYEKLSLPGYQFD